MQAVITPTARAHWPGYIACALAGCCWSTGFYFGKIILSAMGVGHMVFYRFLFACIALIPFALRHRPRLTAREWRLLLIASFLGIPAQYLIQFYGLSLTTVSHAALMVGSVPVLLGGAATLFAGERLDPIGWIALVSSSAGVALIVLAGHHSTASHGPSIEGDLLILASLFISLFWILMNKRLMEHHPPAVITVYGICTGFLMIAAWVFLADGPPPVYHVPLPAWLAAIASGFFCTAGAMLLWNWGIHRVPASRAAVFLNIEPMLGSFLGVMLLGDRLGPTAWVGGGLILAAAIILTTRPHAIHAEGLIE